MADKRSFGRLQELTLDDLLRYLREQPHESALHIYATGYIQLYQKDYRGRWSIRRDFYDPIAFEDEVLSQ